MSAFIWTRKNIDHIAEHGIAPDEAEYVVVSGRAAYWGDGKWLVRGQTEAGRYIQVIYVLESSADELDYTQIDLTTLDDSADAIVVIHARPLTPAERSKLRKRRGKK